jgi:predicted ATPase
MKIIWFVYESSLDFERIKSYNMFVKQLDLRNLRSFEHATLEFGKGINLLVGNNNAGKSTIIKSLYRLQNAQSLGPDDVRITCNNSRIRIELDELSKENTSLFVSHLPGNMKKPGTRPVTVLINTSNGLHNIQKGSEAVYFHGDIPHTIDETGSIKLLETSEGATDFRTFPALETHDNFIYPFLARRKIHAYGRQQIGNKETFEVGDDLRNLTAKIQKLSNSSHSKYDEFISLTRDILQFDIGPIPYRDNEMNTGSYVTDSAMIPVDQMGDGVINILGLLVVLLTSDKKLYLIEEPENDVNPAALKKLLDLVIKKSEQNQFVISTHSNIVVKYLGISTAKIFQLHWKPYYKNPKDRLPTTSISTVESDPHSRLKLLQSLGYDMLDFDLYSSYLFFEESSAERIIRDFLIPWFTPGLSLKVRTMAASGAFDLEPRFHDFLRLFVYVHQLSMYRHKAWVFADGDKAGKDVIGKLKKRFRKTWSSSHFINFSKDDFEEYYPPAFRKIFEKIRDIKDKEERRKKKTQLLNKVLKWIASDQAKARTAFNRSATEIIKHLKRIEKSLEVTED